MDGSDEIGTASLYIVPPWLHVAWESGHANHTQPRVVESGGGVRVVLCLGGFARNALGAEWRCRDCLMHYWMEVVMPHSGQTWTCSGADSSRLDKAEAVEEA